MKVVGDARKDIVVEDFNFNIGAIADVPLIAIYEKPLDYPDKFGA